MPVGPGGPRLIGILEKSHLKILHRNVAKNSKRITFMLNNVTSQEIIVQIITVPLTTLNARHWYSIVDINEVSS